MNPLEPTNQTRHSPKQNITSRNGAHQQVEETRTEDSMTPSATEQSTLPKRRAVFACIRADELVLERGPIGRVSSRSRLERAGWSSGSNKAHAVSGCFVQDGQEMDKSAGSPIRYPARLLLELVELMGIEPMTS
jgi:hypothetical protein